MKVYILTVLIGVIIIVILGVIIGLKLGRIFLYDIRFTDTEQGSVKTEWVTSIERSILREISSELYIINV